MSRYEIIKTMLEDPRAVLLYDGAAKHHTIAGVELHTADRIPELDAMAGAGGYSLTTIQGGTCMQEPEGITYSVRFTQGEREAFTAMAHTFSVDKQDAALRKELREGRDEEQLARKKATDDAVKAAEGLAGKHARDADDGPITINEAAPILLRRAADYAEDAGWLLGRASSSVKAWNLRDDLSRLADQAEAEQAEDNETKKDRSPSTTKESGKGA